MSRLGPSGMLFFAHTVLETVLGAMKLRGRYEGQTAAGPEAKFVRHHGVCLLSLALLAACTLLRREVDAPTGGLVSAVLCFFHTAATAVHAHAFALGSAKSLSTMMMHLPFAVGFAFDALRTRGARDGSARRK
mmetsp:Transcript_19394/g.60579  ORF Transcript_19394/g.60579 Transcript_19394/m.60579 type:complete len:133 (-) Transcript_19394:164-562(-)